MIDLFRFAGGRIACLFGHHDLYPLGTRVHRCHRCGRAFHQR
jgi:hypothetical protein